MILSDTLALLRNVTKSLKITSLIDSSWFKDKEEMLLEQGRLFKKALQQSMYERFKRCDKVAMLMSNVTCVSFANRFFKENQRKRSEIYIGQQHILDYNINIYLDGYVSINMIRRLEIISEGGFWALWTKLRKVLVNAKIRQHAHLETPTMEGNIQVIFTVLPFGIVVSLIVFVLEKLKFYVCKN